MEFICQLKFLFMELTGIKNIIFDLGGVLINLNPSLTHQAFEELGLPQFTEMFTFTHQHDLITQFEVGEIDAHTLRNEVRTLTQQTITDVQFDAAWNAMLLDIPMQRLELLQRAKSGYNTYLLSNSNGLHIPFIHQYVAQEHGIEDFDTLFHKAYYSHLVKMRKPNADIYQLVLDENGLNPEETLFLDDNTANVEAALSLGIKAVKVEKDVTTYLSL